MLRRRQVIDLVTQKSKGTNFSLKSTSVVSLVTTKQRVIKYWIPVWPSPWPWQCVVKRYWGLRDIERTLLDLQTDRPPDRCKTISLLFQGGHYFFFQVVLKKILNLMHQHLLCKFLEIHILCSLWKKRAYSFAPVDWLVCPSADQAMSTQYLLTAFLESCQTWCSVWSLLNIFGRLRLTVTKLKKSECP